MNSDILLAEYREQINQYRHLDNLQERYFYFFILLVTIAIAGTLIHRFPYTFVFYWLLFIFGIFVLDISLHIRQTQLRTSLYATKIVLYFHSIEKNPKIRNILEYRMLAQPLLDKVKEDPIGDWWKPRESKPHRYRSTLLLQLLGYFEAILFATAVTSTLVYISVNIPFPVPQLAILEPYLHQISAGLFITISIAGSFVAVALIRKRIKSMEKIARDELKKKDEEIGKIVRSASRNERAK